MVFCEKRLVDNYNLLIDTFRKHYENTHIFYSIKTNSEIQILKILKDAGSNAEAASAMEVQLALKAGFKPQQITIDGPAWTDEEIEYCVKKGIHTLNVDSVDLMKRVSNQAERLKKKVNVSYRIYPEMKMSILKSFAEGYIRKFGVPVSKAFKAYKLAKQLPYIEPNAISAHIGSMLTDPNYYEKEVNILTKMASDLKKDLDIKIKEINIGGGFGVQSLNYYSIQNIILEKAGISRYSKAPSIEEFGKKVAGTFRQKVEELGISDTKLILEPGSFLVSDAGIMITRVVSVKDKWVFIDGGINLVPESIFFIRRGFIIDGKIDKPKRYKYSIAGPTLNTVDVLGDNLKLPKIEVGDTVVVLDTGAYSLTRSNQFTILRPAALLVDKNKKVKYLRKPESPKQILDLMIY